VQLIIHCGTKETGRSCVELRTSRTRILIDFGMPLVDEKGEPFDSKTLIGRSVDQLKELKILPDIKGLYKGEPKGVDAILISHPDRDHYGLLDHANPDIPRYMSNGAKALIEVSNIFIHNRSPKIDAAVVKPWKLFRIGDLTITPYLVGHSGSDALAFLIEADGKRVYYSGDFQGHGRKDVLFKNMIKGPPENVDYLLLEGPMPGRDAQAYRNEDEIEQRIGNILKETKNIVFLSCSSQHIDRLVSAYRACLKTGRIFVIDLYTAFVLSKLRKVSGGIPQYDSDNIRIKFWRAHADSLTGAGYRDLLYAYNKRKIEMFEIAEKKDNVLMIARDNSVFPLTLKELADVKGAKLIYSMYEKYLGDDLRAKCGKRGIEIEHVHTSGHAVIEDLKTFVFALSPKTLIPINTFHADQYKELFSNVKVMNGEEMLIL